MLNLNSGDAPVPPPPINSEGSSLTKWFVSPQVQNDCDIRSRMCIPSPKRPPPIYLDHRSKALVVLAALGGSMRRLLPGRIDEVAQPGSYGGHNDEDVHWPPQSHNPPLTPTPGTTKAVEAPNPTHFIQVPPLTSPLTSPPPPHTQQISQLQALD
jgi:hypothetical protein